MALDREREVGGAHAAAVVGDADQREPAAAVTTSISPRAGVDRVLDQLLDHARRPLDHLAGGDAVDGLGAELADGHRIFGVRPLALDLTVKNRTHVRGLTPCLR